MSAFYKSISLDQIIHVDKINELTPDQQTVLRDELRIAVDEMNFMVKKYPYKKRLKYLILIR